MLQLNIRGTSTDTGFKQGLEPPNLQYGVQWMSGWQNNARIIGNTYANRGIADRLLIYDLSANILSLDRTQVLVATYLLTAHDCLRNHVCSKKPLYVGYAMQKKKQSLILSLSVQPKHGGGTLCWVL